MPVPSQIRSAGWLPKALLRTTVSKLGLLPWVSACALATTMPPELICMPLFPVTLLCATRVCVAPSSRMPPPPRASDGSPSWRDRDRERGLSCSDGGSCLVDSGGDRCHRACVPVRHVDSSAVGGDGDFLGGSSFPDSGSCLVGRDGDRCHRACAEVRHVGGLAVGGDRDGGRAGSHLDGLSWLVGRDGDRCHRAGTEIGHVGGLAV